MCASSQCEHGDTARGKMDRDFADADAQSAAAATGKIDNDLSAQMVGAAVTKFTCIARRPRRRVRVMTEMVMETLHIHYQNTPRALTSTAQRCVWYYRCLCAERRARVCPSFFSLSNRFPRDVQSRRFRFSRWGCWCAFNARDV